MEKHFNIFYIFAEDKKAHPMAEDSVWEIYDFLKNRFTVTDEEAK